MVAEPSGLSRSIFWKASWSEEIPSEAQMTSLVWIASIGGTCQPIRISMGQAAINMVRQETWLQLLQLHFMAPRASHLVLQLNELPAYGLWNEV